MWLNICLLWFDLLYVGVALLALLVGLPLLVAAVFVPDHDSFKDEL